MEKIFFSEVFNSRARQSVLCWLATVDEELMPNVSPKEMWLIEEDKIIIANVASPISLKNIKSNPKVCVSFIDILVQKGYQCKGKASIIMKTKPWWDHYHNLLTKRYGHNYPFAQIFEIKIEKVKEIIAPSYLLYPDTTSENSQIESSKKAYLLGNEKAEK
jgi:uncharacterized protein